MVELKHLPSLNVKDAEKRVEILADNGMLFLFYSYDMENESPLTI